MQGTWPEHALDNKICPFAVVWNYFYDSVAAFLYQKWSNSDF